MKLLPFQLNMENILWYADSLKPMAESYYQVCVTLPTNKHNSVLVSTINAIAIGVDHSSVAVW